MPQEGGGRAQNGDIPQDSLTGSGTSRTFDEQQGRLSEAEETHRMIKAGGVFDIIGVVLCVVGVTAMANAVGLG